MTVSPAFQSALAITGSVMTLASYVPYVRDILNGSTRPHIFSWLIWSLLTAIGFAALIADSTGPGAWVMGATAVTCFGVFLLSFKQGERSLTVSDWLCLVSALCSIALWFYTSTPLWSVILISVAGTVAFIPTFRKSYVRPGQETLSVYVVGALKWIFGLAAMSHFTVVTVLYPICIVAEDSLFVIMVLCRRHVIERQNVGPII